MVCLLELAESTGLVPGASAPVLYKTLYGPLYALFTLSSVLPFQMILCSVMGVSFAFWEPLRQAAAGAPFFFT
eukprot:4869963-Pleurochrysis_carterae.AAC.1